MNLSEEAHEGWTQFAARHGLTLAALFEVLGLVDLDDALKQRALDKIVTDAREIAHERRRAGGPKKRL